jgi:HKD family nuclease
MTELQHTLNSLILKSSNIDIIVGYANLRGFDILSRALESVDKIRILVGMEKDQELVRILTSLPERIVTSSTRLDRFVQFLTSGKLEIRFTKEGKQHSKVYLFNLRDGGNRAIVGSSNLTKSGLELNKEVSRVDDDDSEKLTTYFESEWLDSISADVGDLTSEVEKLKEKVGVKPVVLSQYEMFIKTLHTIYGDTSPIPSGGKAATNFKSLQYQEDAVVQLKTILKTHNGCFLADVVGLGKTYTSTLSLLDLPLNSRVIILSPVGVVSAWRSVLEEFNLGFIEVLSHHQLHRYTKQEEDKEYVATEPFTHVYVDEAHKFRNAKTTGYKQLKAICHSSSSPRTKVVLITATPLNNNPSELKNMLALFQSLKGWNSLVGLGTSLNTYLRQPIIDVRKARDSNDKVIIDSVIKSVGGKLRKDIINKITVRRTRKDIERFYKEDIDNNGWSFPVVQKPVKIEYDIESAQNTILELTQEKFADMTFARYKLHEYLSGGVFDESHKYLSNIIKTNLMKRLDSSFTAFVYSLKNIARKYAQTIDDFENHGIVRKVIRDSVTGKMLDGDTIPVDMLGNDKYSKEDFITHVKSDLKSLNSIIRWWDGIEDVKLAKFIALITSFDFTTGKLLVFSQYKDTVNYLKGELESLGFRVLSYSAEVKNTRDVVDANFDANSITQLDDYDILVTTDSLSEGVNLHRANKVVNYDIPWNPTLVIQRVGRSNRIGTKFKSIEIYNFFPFEGTDKVIKSDRNIISKLKTVFHLFGDDTDVLTDGNDLDSIETIEEQIHSSLQRSEFEESEEVNTDAYYQKCLRVFKSGNRSRFNWLSSLTGDIFSTKNVESTDIESLFTLLSEVRTQFYVTLDGKVSSHTKHEFLTLLECEDTPLTNYILDYEKVEKQKKLLLGHLSFKSKAIVIFEDNGFDTGGAITFYMKSLFIRETDPALKAQVKAQVKKLLEGVRKKSYVPDSYHEKQMLAVVKNNGSLDELKELFEECEVSEENIQDISYNTILVTL